ncbi:hypothetical protein [Corynebacterium macginleyi]|uniref:hypothetical protein n=1 Tax=Corynebacterium macginleyi TaxID=38290 RepID=UPI001EF125BD|nr:hypothetical protein [Corynebacterium macginleyi]
MLRQVIVLGVDEARALHNSGKNHRASLLAEVVGIVLDVAVAVDFGARPPACPLFGGRALLSSRITTAVKKLTEVQKYLAASLNDIGYSQAKVAKIAHTSQARVGHWIRSVEGDLPPRAKRPW